MHYVFFAKCSLFFGISYLLRVKAFRRDSYFKQCHGKQLSNVFETYTGVSKVKCAEKCQSRMISNACSGANYNKQTGECGLSNDTAQMTTDTDVNHFVALKLQSDSVHDCTDILRLSPTATSGVYHVSLPVSGQVQSVYCDMGTDGGGWTVFQRRNNGAVDFYRTFDEYVDGFGDTSGEFWIGLNAIQQMTSNLPSDLKIQLTPANTLLKSIYYDNFYLSPSPGFTLHVEVSSKSGEIFGQWVKSVVGFSSQYDSNRWAAEQVIGEPDVYPKYGDLEGSWAQKTLDAKQYLKVYFEEKVLVTKIDIYETFHAGGVKKVSALIPNTATGTTDVFPLYTAASIVDLGTSRIFSPTLQPIDKATDTIQIDIDCSVSKKWVEIDAIRLYGTHSFGIETNNLGDFSTFDHDADTESSNCAALNHGGWWYRDSCTEININGHYAVPGTQSSYNGGLGGVISQPFKGTESLKATLMMFRKK